MSIKKFLLFSILFVLLFGSYGYAQSSITITEVPEKAKKKVEKLFVKKLKKLKH